MFVFSVVLAALSIGAMRRVAVALGGTVEALAVSSSPSGTHSGPLFAAALGCGSRLTVSDMQKRRD